MNRTARDRIGKSDIPHYDGFSVGIGRLAINVGLERAGVESLYEATEASNDCV